MGLRLNIIVDITLRVVVRRMRGPLWEHHAYGLGNGAHRVGREHRTTGATSRHRALRELGEFFIGNSAGFMRGAALDVVHNGEVVALGGPGFKINTTR